MSISLLNSYGSYFYFNDAPYQDASDVDHTQLQTHRQTIDAVFTLPIPLLGDRLEAHVHNTGIWHLVYHAFNHTKMNDWIKHKKCKA